LLIQTRTCTLKVGQGHYDCAANGLIHLAVSVRHDLRTCLQGLADAAGGIKVLEKELNLLSKAVALAWRPESVLEPLTKACREQLGKEGLAAYERLRVDSRFRAEARRVRYGRLLKRVGPFLDIDLAHLRAEVDHEFARANACPPPKVPDGSHDIELLPGGFLLWGKVRGELTGKPLGVLRALRDSPGRCLARAEIFRRVWEENTLTNAEQAVRDALSAIRTAFQKAFIKARVKLLPKHNFIPGRGRGEDRVYELNLPPPRA
jgi:hypothetical protein